MKTIACKRELTAWMVAALVLLVSAIAPAATPPDDNWQADVQGILDQQLACTTPIDDQTPCNVFLGRALKRVYNITDFEVPEHPDTYLSANDIATYVASNSNWTLLGTADSQSALDQAQGYANLGKAIIAVYLADPNGHVSLIVPGQQTSSDKWGLNVPNSASFFLGNPKIAYVGKPLSFAFGPDLKGSVKLYGRNF